MQARTGPPRAQETKAPHSRNPGSAVPESAARDMPMSPTSPGSRSVRSAASAEPVAARCKLPTPNWDHPAWYCLYRFYGSVRWQCASLPQRWSNFGDKLVDTWRRHPKPMIAIPILALFTTALTRSILAAKNTPSATPTLLTLLNYFIANTPNQTVAGGSVMTLSDIFKWVLLELYLGVYSVTCVLPEDPNRIILVSTPNGMTCSPPTGPYSGPLTCSANIAAEGDFENTFGQLQLEDSGAANPVTIVCTSEVHRGELASPQNIVGNLTVLGQPAIAATPGNSAQLTVIETDHPTDAPNTLLIPFLATATCALVASAMRRRFVPQQYRPAVALLETAACYAITSSQMLTLTYLAVSLLQIALSAQAMKNALTWFYTPPKHQDHPTTLAAVVV